MSEQQARYITEAEEALQMLGKGYNNDPIPPTQFISTISGVTPAPDTLVNQYGYVTALVWGRVWRHCQMYDGVCRAAIDTIATSLGMSGRTIIRHLDDLCRDGYLLDMTPDLRNKPHIYADTGKIKVRVSFDVGMTESHSHYDRESIEESTTNSKDNKNIFALYESNIGVLTSIMADTLQEAEKEYPTDWIFDAVKLAVENNKRNWKYCEAILKRWKADGKDNGKKEQPQTETVRLL